MARDLEQLVLTMSADLRRFERGMLNAQNSADKAMRNIERRVAEADRKVAQFGSEAGAMFTPLSASAAVAFGAIATYAVRAASDAAEVENAFSVAFKNGTKEAETFANTLADRVGRDVIELQQGMTRLQLVITGTGVEAAKSADLVKALTERAVDVGSLFNVSDEQALGSFISGLTGETEPLKQFGVVINETAVKAELLRLGFKGNAEQASEAAKSIARANLILKGTAVAAGDAEKTADGAANRFKALRAQANEAARDLGNELLPTVVKLTEAGTKLLKTFNDMPGGMQVAGLAMLALIAAGVPGYVVQEGQFLSVIVGGQRYLYQAAAEAVASGGGTAAVVIRPNLRAAPPDGAVVEFNPPIIEGFLQGREVSWSLDAAQTVGLSFSIMERA